MRFDHLDEKNHLMFAIKYYENPQSVTVDDFLEDMKKFKYLKRLLKRYLKTGVLRTTLILNHLNQKEYRVLLKKRIDIFF